MALTVFSPEHPDHDLIKRALAGDQLAVAEAVARGYWLMVSPAVPAGGQRKAILSGRENAPDGIDGLERFLTGGS